MWVNRGAAVHVTSDSLGSPKRALVQASIMKSIQKDENFSVSKDAPDDDRLI